MQADATMRHESDKPEVCALVLLAHGSRSANWTAPFERLCKQMQARWSNGPVCLAYFEHSTPSLEDVIGALIARLDIKASAVERSAGGAWVVRRIHIEPLLLAAGFHVQTDLPERMSALETKYPGLMLTAGTVLIEAPLIQQAILQNCLASLETESRKLL